MQWGGSQSLAKCNGAATIGTPGMTSLAPTMGAQKARPQLLAWNMGTTASTVVLLAMQKASGCATVKLCRKLALCE